MPHTLFPTTFGPCGIAWNEIGLTGLQLPEAEEAQVAQKLAQRTHTQPAGATLPPAISQLIERIQQQTEQQLLTALIYYSFFYHQCYYQEKMILIHA